MRRSSRNRGLARFAVALLWTGSAAYAEDPNSEPVGETYVEAGEVTTPAFAPIANPNGDRLDAGVLTPKQVRMDPLYHRGGTYTDAGEGRANVLNEVELRKFAAARAAIEASRAAGTLYIVALPDDTVPATPADVEQMKLDQLRAQLPIVTESDPVAGVGENLPTDAPLPEIPTEIVGDYGPRPQPQPLADAVSPATEGVIGDE